MLWSLKGRRQYRSFDSGSFRGTAIDDCDDGMDGLKGCVYDRMPQLYATRKNIPL